MKLTKGRLSKIKKMKKQTRYNRKKSGGKRGNKDTFRRRKSKHFLYKSLKKRRRVQKAGNNGGTLSTVLPSAVATPLTTSSKALQDSGKQLQKKTGMSTTSLIAPSAQKQIDAASSQYQDAKAYAKQVGSHEDGRVMGGYASRKLHAGYKSAPLSLCQTTAVNPTPDIASAYWKDNECTVVDAVGKVKHKLTVGTFINDGVCHPGEDGINIPVNADPANKATSIHLQDAVILDITEKTGTGYNLLVQNNVYGEDLEKPITILIQTQEKATKSWTWKTSPTNVKQNLIWSIVKYKSSQASGGDKYGVVVSYVASPPNKSNSYYVIWNPGAKEEDGTQETITIGAQGNNVIEQVMDSFPICVQTISPHRPARIPLHPLPPGQVSKTSFEKELKRLAGAALLFKLKDSLKARMAAKINKVEMGGEPTSYKWTFAVDDSEKTWFTSKDLGDFQDPTSGNLTEEESKLQFIKDNYLDTPSDGDCKLKDIAPQSTPVSHENAEDLYFMSTSNPQDVCEPMLYEQFKNSPAYTGWQTDLNAALSSCGGKPVGGAAADDDAAGAAAGAAGAAAGDAAGDAAGATAEPSPKEEEKEGKKGKIVVGKGDAMVTILFDPAAAHTQLEGTGPDIDESLRNLGTSELGVKKPKGEKRVPPVVSTATTAAAGQEHDTTSTTPTTPSTVMGHEQDTAAASSAPHAPLVADAQPVPEPQSLLPKENATDDEVSAAAAAAVRTAHPDGLSKTEEDEQIQLQIKKFHQKMAQQKKEMESGHTSLAPVPEAQAVAVQPQEAVPLPQSGQNPAFSSTETPKSEAAKRQEEADLAAKDPQAQGSPTTQPTTKQELSGGSRTKKRRKKRKHKTRKRRKQTKKRRNKAKKTKKRRKHKPRKGRKSRKAGGPGNPNEDGSEFKIPTEEEIDAAVKDEENGNVTTDNWIIKLQNIVDGEIGEAGLEGLNEGYSPPNTSDRARDAMNALANIYDAYDVEDDAAYWEGMYEKAQQTFTRKPAKQTGWWDKATPAEEERFNNFDANPMRSLQQEPSTYGASRINNRGEREVWRQGTPPVGGSSRKRRRKKTGKN